MTKAAFLFICFLMPFGWLLLDDALIELFLLRFYLPVGAVLFVLIWLRPAEEMIGLLATVPFIVALGVWGYIAYIFLFQTGESGASSVNMVFGFFSTVWIFMFGLLHFGLCNFVYYLFKEFELFERAS